MNLVKMLLVCLAARVSDVHAQISSSPASTPVMVEHVNVLAMTADSALRDHTIIVAGDTIAWLGPATRAIPPAGALRIDGSGAWVVPGLADMHVHLTSTADLAQYVRNGITTVRNMNGRPVHLAWRNSARRPGPLIPVIYAAAPAVGPGFVRLRNMADVNAYVAEQAQAKYDFIKVLGGIKRPVFERLVAVARDSGLTVAGHVVKGIGLEPALAAGQRSIEHADAHIFGGRLDRVDEGARAIARSGTWVGTLVLDRDGQCRPPTEEQRRVVTALRRANVRLLVGTDAGIAPIRHGTSLLCELKSLVTLGMSPYEALRAATRDAGEFAAAHLGEKRLFGTVSVGARADLVLLDGDPRRDLETLSRPRGVLLRGIWLPNGTTADVRR